MSLITPLNFLKTFAVHALAAVPNSGLQNDEITAGYPYPNMYVQLPK